MFIGFENLKYKRKLKFWILHYYYSPSEEMIIYAYSNYILMNSKLISKFLTLEKLHVLSLY